MAPNITPDDENATIAAKVLKTLDRRSFYYPRKVALNSLPSMTPVATHEEGVVPEVTEAMIEDDSFPVRWADVGGTVALEVDSQRWVAARIQSLDADQLEWSHRKRLE